MRIEQAKRLKELEQESSRLKRLVADLSLDKPCGETSCFRAVSTTRQPALPPGESEISAPPYTFLFSRLFHSCSYFTGVSHFKWTYFRGAGQQDNSFAARERMESES